MSTTAPPMAAVLTHPAELTIGTQLASGQLITQLAITGSGYLHVCVDGHPEPLVQLAPDEQIAVARLASRPTDAAMAAVAALIADMERLAAEEDVMAALPAAIEPGGPRRLVAPWSRVVHLVDEAEGVAVCGIGRSRTVEWSTPAIDARERTCIRCETA